MGSLQYYPMTNENPGDSRHAALLPQFTVCSGCRLRVQGKGIVRAEPDKVTVILGVVTENVQLETAQRENAEKTASVINALLNLGIQKEAIQTQSYTIEPVYDYIDGKQVFRGYRVTHNLKVEIKNVGMAGKIIDTAVAAGANTVSGISFSVSEPSLYYKEALIAALNDAKAKANTIGAGLGVYVYPIPLQIVEEAYQQATPYNAVYMQAQGTTTPIQPGQIEITATIGAIFSYACR